MMRIAVPPLSPTAFADHDPAAPIIQLDGLTMGTAWRVLYAAPRIDVVVLRAAIVRRLDGLIAEMSHWATDSRLARFNRATPGSWVTLPPDFAHVVAAGLRIAADSDSAFDPAIGRLVDLWGFGPPGPCPAPNDGAVAAALGVSGWRRLAYEAAGRRLRQPGGLALDLSGIAKGHAVDALVQLLKEGGVAHALVEIGGELRGIGLRPDGDPWWVDLEVPPGTDVAPLRVALHDLAVATSGDYRRGGHNIDPATGRPARHGVVSASVLHAGAMEADAWASALTVLGPGAGIALADRHGLTARVVTVVDGGAHEYLSRGLLAMLEE